MFWGCYSGAAVWQLKGNAGIGGNRLFIDWLLQNSNIMAFKLDMGKGRAKRALNARLRILKLRHNQGQGKWVNDMGHM